MGPTRIVSIDGGGVRGVVPTVVLQRLSADPRLAGWLDRADFFAGTSTGGLIALGLAARLDLATIRALYEERAARVFRDSFLDDVLDLGKIIGADYEIRNLRRELEAVFGDLRLGDLAPRRVLVTAFDLDNEHPQSRTWKPKIFHNFDGCDSDGEMLVSKVGVYTSAAPTYFASEDGFVDGGVFATNPSMCALAQTQDGRNDDGLSPLDDVRLLSLGTGRSLQYIEGSRHDWGYAQWVRPLISIMLDGTNGIADFQCQQILGDRYRRVDPTFPQGTTIAMDDVERIPDLIAFAETIDLDEVADWLAASW